MRICKLLKMTVHLYEQCRRKYQVHRLIVILIVGNFNKGVCGECLHKYILQLNCIKVFVVMYIS